MVRRNIQMPRDKGNKKRRRGVPGEDALEVQQPGKLMLNNPLIPPELDEDIDDDLAFDSEDERMYGHLFAKKSEGNPSKVRKTSKRLRSQGLDSDDDQLQGQMDALGRVESAGKGRKTRKDDDELYNYQEEGQSSDGEDYIDLSDMLDISLKEDAKKATKKKAVRIAEDGELVTKKRRKAKATEEAESLYGTAIVEKDGGSPSYSAAIRNFIKKEGSSREETVVKNRLEHALRSKHNLLSVDMDEKSKERLTRKEVRAVVDENMGKYKTVLREINTSKHVQLPMPMPESTPTPSSIGGIVAVSEARFQTPGALPVANSSAGKLASRMNALLTSAGLSKQQLAGVAPTSSESLGDRVQFADGEGDEGMHNFACPQEGAPTSTYMGKLKAMLAYENSRRKRFNRIKSKTYRRILRKEKDREKERRQKAFELLHPEIARKRLAEKLLKARAEERVTQKHKNTSAWVRHAKRFADFDTNAKDAINEQLTIHQNLMRKMDESAGEEYYNQYARGNDFGSEASSEDERVVDQLLAAASGDHGHEQQPDVKSMASVLWQSAQGDAKIPNTATPIERARAELREMKFMKSAKERDEKEYDMQLMQLKEDIQEYHRSGANEADTEREEHAPAAQTKEIAPTPRAPGSGRLRFAEKPKAVDTVEAIQLKKPKGIVAVSWDSGFPEHGSNDDGDFFIEDDDEVESDEGKGILRRAQRRSAAGGTKHIHRLHSSEFAGDRVAPVTSGCTSTRVAILPRHAKQIRGDDPDDGNDSGCVQSQRGAEQKDSVGDDPAVEDLRLHQEYLVSRAFAHDDVDEDFLKEKEGQVEAIMRPEDKNAALPGWGDWGGENPELNKRHHEKVAHMAVQRQIEKSFLMKSRADASLDHVIINHDGVELVPNRMTLHMVPRPFSNPQEFARSMRQPLGPEWTSALSFKEGVQPRVEVRQGHAVLPLDLSLRSKKAKTKRRKVEAKAS